MIICSPSAEMTLRSLLTSIFVACVSVASAAVWQTFPSFYGDVNHVTETPGFVYFTSKVLPSNNFFPDEYSLFRFDKEGEELQVLSVDNLLSCNTITHMVYSPEKGYIAVVCSNYDIDLIGDDGNIVSIPDYRIASTSLGKRINAVSISPAADRIYLATDFGYVEINDRKYEIAGSCILGEPLKSVAAIGNHILAIHGDDLLAMESGKRATSLDDFEKIATFSGLSSLYVLDKDKCVVISGSGPSESLRLISVDDDGVKAGDPVPGNFLNIDNNRDGLLVTSGEVMYQIKRDGSISALPLPGSGESAGSLDLRDLWLVDRDRGLRCVRESGDGGFVTTRGYMTPNSPVPFISTEMRLHPERGVLLQNYGFDYNLARMDGCQELLISGYKDGEWHNYSPGYTAPEQRQTLTRPGGFAVDPDNPDYIYVSSVENGFARINLVDGNNIIHLSKPTDPSRDLPGFVEFVPEQTGSNRWSCRFSAPRFDQDGNLWMSYADFDDQTPPRLRFVCWERDKLRNTTSADNIQLPGFLDVPGLSPTNTDELLPLNDEKHSGWLLYCNKAYEGAFLLIDTGGTPLENGDDRISVISSVVDQDGNQVSFHNVRCMWEDSRTGNVWVGHSDGVFYFNPDDFMNGTGRVNRVKVARKDGTGLADYLLNLVTVNKIAGDSDGRIWFATNGGGVVALSSDGGSIEYELTTENSGLPDNTVFSLVNDPVSHAMIFSTSGGIAGYLIRGGASGSAENVVRAYPNPVRPDYIGYVTIDGLPDDALVKIMDGSGNMVKELRTQGNGEVSWDVTNLHFRRVGSGVYFILVSGKETGSEFSNVGKILVVN